MKTRLSVRKVALGKHPHPNPLPEGEGAGNPRCRCSYSGRVYLGILEDLNVPQDSSSPVSLFVQTSELLRADCPGVEADRPLAGGLVGEHADRVAGHAVRFE